MPTYCYRTDDGELHEVQKPIGSQPQEITLEDGRVARRDFRAELSGSKACDNWPMVSWNAGVNPDEVAKYSKFVADKGVPTEFTKEGEAVFTSKKHRDKYLKAMGYTDRSAWN